MNLSYFNPSDCVIESEVESPIQLDVVDKNFDFKKAFPSATYSISVQVKNSLLVSEYSEPQYCETKAGK